MSLASPNMAGRLLRGRVVKGQFPTQDGPWRVPVAIKGFLGNRYITSRKALEEGAYVDLIERIDGGIELAQPEAA